MHSACCSGTSRAAAPQLILGVLMASTPTAAPLALPQLCFPNLHMRPPSPPQIGDLVCKSQAIGLTRFDFGKAMRISGFDGFLGLAYPSLALQNTTPVFDSMWNQGLISKNLFAFYLSR